VAKCCSDKPEIFKDEEVKAFAFSLALHIAAFNPYALDKSKIDPAYIAEQEEIFRKQMEQDEKLQGKPANVLEGILKGKINKHLSEICLLEQGYVKDEKMTVAQALADQAKKAGAKFEIADYVYYKVGA
jgi:elongation factor Ts